MVSKWKKHKIQTRLLSLLLCISMLLPSTSITAMAAAVDPKAQSQETAAVGAADFDPALVAELQKLCGDKYDATEVLQQMYGAGLVDEKGHPDLGDTFQVNDAEYTKAELEAELANHEESEAVTVDGTECTWGDIGKLFDIKNSVDAVAEYLEGDADWNEENINSLDSFVEQMKNGGVQTISSEAVAEMTMYHYNFTSAGTSFGGPWTGAWTEADKTKVPMAGPDWRDLNDTNANVDKSKLVKFTLKAPSNKDVSFKVRLESGEKMLKDNTSHGVDSRTIELKVATDAQLSDTGATNSAIKVNGVDAAPGSTIEYDATVTIPAGKTEAYFYMNLPDPYAGVLGPPKAVAFQNAIAILNVHGISNAIYKGITANTDTTGKEAVYQAFAFTGGKDIPTYAGANNGYNDTDNRLKETVKFVVPEGNYTPGMGIPIFVFYPHSVRYDLSSNTNSFPIKFYDQTIESLEMQTETKYKKGDNYTYYFSYIYEVPEVATGGLDALTVDYKTAGYKDGQTFHSYRPDTIAYDSYFDLEGFDKSSLANVRMISPLIMDCFEDSSQGGTLNADGTVVIDLDIKQSNKAYYQWITQNSKTVATPVELVGKNGTKYTCGFYVGCMYASFDGANPEERIPLYIVVDESKPIAEQQPTKLIANFTPGVNKTGQDVTQTVELYYQEDGYDKDFFDADKSKEGKASAKFTGSYTVKPSIMLDKNNNDVAITYGTAWPGDGKDAIYVGDPEANTDFSLKYTVKTDKEFTYAKARDFEWISSDKEIATITTEVTDQGKLDAEVTLTGTKDGPVKFTLKVKNGGGDNTYTLETKTYNVKTVPYPFFGIPKTSQTRKAVQNGSLDIAFSTNITAKNAESSKDTTIGIKIYECDDSGANITNQTPIYTEDIVSQANSPVTKVTIPEGILTKASSASGYSYIAELSTHFLYESLDKEYTSTAKIHVKRVPAVVKLEQLESYFILDDKPMEVGWSIVGFDTGSANKEAEYIIEKEGTVVKEGKIDTAKGSVTLSENDLKVADKLKDIYTVTVKARNNPDEEISTDSYVLNVYNHDALKILMTPNSEASKKYVYDKDTDTYFMDDTAYVKSLLETSGTGDAKDRRLNLGGANPTFEELRNEVALQSIVSINYGEYAWGILSDQIAWAATEVGQAEAAYTMIGRYDSYSAAKVYYTQSGEGTETSPYVYEEKKINSSKEFKDLIAAAEAAAEETEDKTFLINLYYVSGDSGNIYYEQGGYYSSLDRYVYLSYMPNTDFLTTATKDGKFEINAVHARNGMKDKITIDVKTMKNKLYMFQLLPEAETTITYTNGDGKEVTVKTDAQGKLVLYEPSGIKTDVRCLSAPNGETHVGTIPNDTLVSAEENIAYMYSYPVNTKNLVNISKVTLTFLNQDGSPAANQTMKLKGGIYKESKYCKNAGIAATKGNVDQSAGRTGITVTTNNIGQADIYMDSTQFIVSDSAETLRPGMKFSYIFEVTPTNGNYDPTLISLESVGDLGIGSAIQGTVDLKTKTGTPNVCIQSYYNKNGVIDITKSSENVGPSYEFNSVAVISQALFGNSTTLKDDATGFQKVDPAHTYEYIMHAEGTDKEDGQSGTAEPKDYYTITDLARINDIVGEEDGNYFIKDDVAHVCAYPFSTYPVIVNSWVMDGTTFGGTNNGGTWDWSNAWLEPEDQNKSVTASFKQDGKALVSKPVNWQIINQVGTDDPNESPSMKRSSGKALSTLTSNLEIGSLMGSMEGGSNTLLSGGVAKFAGLMSGGKYQLNMSVVPTENPLAFKILMQVEEAKAASGMNIAYSATNNIADLASKLDDVANEGPAKVSLEFSLRGGVTALAICDEDTGKWSIVMTGGNFGGTGKVKFEYSQEFQCGPVPGFVDFEAGLKAEFDFGAQSQLENKEWYQDYLIELGIGAYINVFAGVGKDMGLIAFKIGIIGEVGVDAGFEFLMSDKIGNKVGGSVGVRGSIGLKMECTVLLMKFEFSIMTPEFGAAIGWGDHDVIVDYWEGVTDQGGAYSATKLADGRVLYTLETQGLNDRSYLDQFERSWKSADGTAMMAVAPGTVARLSEVQSNTYSEANPVFTDDGAMALYATDLGSADAQVTDISYGTYDKTSQAVTDKGSIAPDEITSEAIEAGTHGFGDSGLAASGTNSKYFATWVRQSEKIHVEDPNNTTNQELSLMINSTEIMVSSYDGSKWVNKQLTDNAGADLAPTIASNANGKAVVAWRSTAASDAEAPLDFNVENYLVYSTFDGTKWSDEKVAYNGTNGKIQTQNAVMMSDGTVCIIYTVDAAEVAPDADGKVDQSLATETFYTIINPAGEAVTTLRMTNNQDVDMNAQASVVTRAGKEQFILAWYTKYPGEGDSFKNDVRLAAVNADGSLDSSFIDSISSTGDYTITPTFKLAAKSGGSVDDLMVVWKEKKAGKTEGTYEELDVVKAIKLYEKDGMIGATTEQIVSELNKYQYADHIDAISDGNTVHTILKVSDFSAGVTTVGGTITKEDEVKQLFEAVAEPKMITAYAEFKDSFAVNAIGYSAKDIIPGTDLPMTVSFVNTGLNPITEVIIKIGNKPTTFSGLDIKAGAKQSFNIYHKVSSPNVTDVVYTVTAKAAGQQLGTDKGTNATGTLALNKPDVGVASVKQVKEQNGSRSFQVTLNNDSYIPLAGSGKTIKVGLYADASCSDESKLASGEITGEMLALADAGAYVYQGDAAVVPMLLKQHDKATLEGAGWTFSAGTSNMPSSGDYLTVKGKDANTYYPVSKIGEIPNDGYMVYAKAWLAEADGTVCSESNEINNGMAEHYNGPLKKNNTAVTASYTMEMKETEGEVSSIDVKANIRNNSMQVANLKQFGLELVDAEGNMLAFKQLPIADREFQGEAQKDITLAFTKADLADKDAKFADVVAVRQTEIHEVYFELNGHGDEIDAIFAPKGKKLIAPEKPAVEGWVFKGWYRDQACTDAWDMDKDVIEGDTTLYAKWIEGKVVSYDIQGHGTDTPKNQTLEEGEKITKPDDLIAEGYVFRGWFKEAECTTAWDFETDTITKSMTLYAKWNKIHKVTFNLRGHGTSGEIAEQQIEDGLVVEQPKDPSDSGDYIFKGWYPNVNFETPWNFETDTITKDTIIHARWLDAIRTSFDTQGKGTAPKESKVEIGSKIEEPEEPTANGYVFSGWFIDQDCKMQWNFAKDSVTEHATLYAKWTDGATVSYNVQGHGKTPQQQTVLYNQKITKPEALTADGFVFKGWYTDKECTKGWDFAKDVMTKNITLYAKWEAGKLVTYDVLGHGKKPKNETVSEGGKVTKPKAPAEANQIFKGWYKDKECTKGWDFAKDTVSSDITLYAKWNKLCTISFEMNGQGVKPAAQVVEKEGKITEPKLAAVAGYVFKGWYTNAALKTKWDFAKDTVGDHSKLYAKWTKLVTVSYDTQGIGATPEAQTVENGARLTKPNDLKLPGYVFKGWYRDKECNTKWDFVNNLVTNDITIYGKWVRTYTVTFNNKGHGLIPVPQVIEAGSYAIRGMNPQASGYVFKGWYSDVNCTKSWIYSKDAVNSNMTLYAKWLKNSTITVKGGTGSGTYLEGENPQIKAETKKGYTFAGWKITSGKVDILNQKKTPTTIKVGVSNVTVEPMYVVNKGTILESSNAAYKIKKAAAYSTSSGKYTTTGTVEYMKPLKRASSYTVPDTVKLGGITYKVTAINKAAFYKDKKVTSIKIGNNVLKIKKDSFRECTKLKTVTFGAGLKEIENTVFGKVKSIKTVTFKAKSLKVSGSTNMFEKGVKVTINVPKSALAKYKKVIKSSGSLIFKGK